MNGNRFPDLEGAPVEGLAVVRLGGGGNSRVYRVEAEGERWVVKAFYPNPMDHRDRFDSEHRALALLDGYQAPPLLGIEPARRLVAMGFVAGTPLNEIGVADVDQALSFIAHLVSLARKVPISAVPRASEACFSLSELEQNLMVRLDSLKDVEDSSARTFVQETLAPAVAAGVARAAKLMGTAAEADLEPNVRILSPSDFGFHNALRDSEGRLTFFDFEHFGWDDPVKLLSDLLLHPAMNLDDETKTRFITGIRTMADASFDRRFEAYFPLYGLKWCCILLNEFLPHHLARRCFAQGSASESQARQLAKAIALFDTLRRQHALST